MINAALIVASALTITSLLICGLIVRWAPEQELAKRLFNTCETTWKMGFGAIIGLLAAS